MTVHDHEAFRKVAMLAEQSDGPVCRCPTCGVALLLLRSALNDRSVRPQDQRRVTIQPSGLGSCAYPYLASVRVDGKEVYRIEARPDEVLSSDVVEDITSALERNR